MGYNATIVPTITGAQFAGRIAANLPPGWAGSDAVQSGLVSSMLLSFGTELAAVLQELQYAANAQRLQTETYPELDLASQDYLGTLLPRPNGMGDLDYADLIIAHLFRSAATRQAISNALTLLTGYTPRMLEPWNIYDTGSFDNNSYIDVDTVANPARLGDGSLVYQGFIETPPPTVAAIGPSNVVQTMDDGAYWDVPGYFCGTLSQASAQSVYDLINTIRAYGTTCWVKFVGSTPQTAVVAPTAPTAVSATSSSPTTAAVSFSLPATGTPPLSYQIFYQISGATTWTLATTAVSSPAVVSNLQPRTTYQFAVVASNAAGASPKSTPAAATTQAVVPGPATGLQAVAIGVDNITLSWNLPTTGTPPLMCQVLYRVTGTTTWSAWAAPSTATVVTVSGLQANTEYDFEVRTSNV